MSKNQTIKIWVQTVGTLREIQELTGEKMVTILDRAVQFELRRTQNRIEKLKRKQTERDSE